MITNPSFILSDAAKLITIKALLKTSKRIERFSLWKTNCINKVFTMKLLCNKVGIKSKVVLSVFNILNEDRSAHAVLLIDNSIEFLALPNSSKHTINLQND